MPLELVVIPCLSDNFAYLIHDAVSRRTAVIDVPEAAPVLAVLADRAWILSDIWLTHHHWDHIDGVAALQTATGAKVTGAAADAHRLPPLDHPLSLGQGFDFAGHDVEVIDVPGHTVGHIAFYIASERLAFTGDSLMAAGCGKMAEDNAPEYWQSLSRLASLPIDTLICSGHEYTTNNLRFAQSLEHDNPALILRSERVAALRAEGKPSVPVRLAEELSTNPFLRAGTPGLKKALGMSNATDVQVFAAIRSRKDRF